MPREIFIGYDKLKMLGFDLNINDLTWGPGVFNLESITDYVDKIDCTSENCVGNVILKYCDLFCDGDLLAANLPLLRYRQNMKGHLHTDHTIRRWLSASLWSRKWKKYYA